MKIIVGLGNIGQKYITTRHNAGFLALDELVHQIESTGQKIEWKEESKLNAFTTRIPFNDEILFLVKPNTMMNLSGLAVSKVLNFFKETIDNLIVIYDDIDLPVGKIRYRDKGSAGSHNGMRSIIQELGSQDFKRIRIGIESRGVHAPAEQEISSFVLSNFNEKEYPEIKSGIKQSIEELKNLL